jgi:hypothetical protein
MFLDVYDNDNRKDGMKILAAEIGNKSERNCIQGIST